MDFVVEKSLPDWRVIADEGVFEDLPNGLIESSTSCICIL